MDNEKLVSHEEWKPIPGSIYEISSFGRVRNSNTGHIRKDQNKHGYRRINIRVNGTEKHYAVHRLVAIAFIDNPDNKPQVNHKDGDKANNHVDNLEWVTGHENLAHAVENHLWEKGCERAKANGGSNGYNRKDKPKAYLKKAEIMAKNEYDYVIRECEKNKTSVYMAVKGYFDSKPIGDVINSATKSLRHENSLLKEKNERLQKELDNERKENQSKCIKYDNDDFKIGTKYGYLTIIGYAYQYPDKPGSSKMVVCRCDCGNVKVENSWHLKNGTMKSCGCKKNELFREAICCDDKKKDWLYSLWSRRHRSPEWYEEWKDYNVFYEWSYNNGYSFGKRLWRIDSQCAFSPTNCMWRDKQQHVTPKQKPKRNVRRYECNGEMLSIPEMCDKYNVSEPFIRYRVKRRGMTYSEAVNEPKTCDGRPQKQAV